MQDTAKCLVITFISPPFWARILRPGTKRAELLRWVLRMPLEWLLRI